MEDVEVAATKKKVGRPKKGGRKQAAAKKPTAKKQKETPKKTQVPAPNVHLQRPGLRSQVPTSPPDSNQTESLGTVDNDAHGTSHHDISLDSIYDDNDDDHGQGGQNEDADQRNEPEPSVDPGNTGDPPEEVHVTVPQILGEMESVPNLNALYLVCLKWLSSMAPLHLMVVTAHLDTDRTDHLADAYKPQDFGNMTPILTSGYGNCLQNAVSHLVYGHESNHQEIRVRMLWEAFTNFERYLDNDFLRQGHMNVEEGGPDGEALDVVSFYTSNSKFFNSAADPTDPVEQ